jgi:hypothetical protein
MRRAARTVCTLLDQSNSHPAEISIFAFVISISAWTTRPVKSVQPAFRHDYLLISPSCQHITSHYLSDGPSSSLTHVFAADDWSIQTS